ncbi:hypothetical protein Ahy_B08g089341 [Arachis hypogaea]|uniref:Aminotransferase-like plant mobile domain-containing protein n=1 Tax=Arachis hypogaea TaxID=3818 RepID=A0A444XXR5_ARAHY|nr:hypothetical protein Ahy_B08g089341 [Arachis hypogaea]
MHWKFLLLLRNFGGIREFSWGSACLAHLYRALCRATRVDYKEIDAGIIGSVIIGLTYISLLLTLGGYWTICRKDRYPYYYLFVWEAYAVDRIEAGVIPADIRHHSVIWSAIVPLISFECIELRRQFGLSQGVPHQERDLGHAHGEVLTGPKNEDWSDMHSFFSN